MSKNLTKSLYLSKYKKNLISILRLAGLRSSNIIRGHQLRTSTNGLECGGPPQSEIRNSRDGERYYRCHRFPSCRPIVSCHRISAPSKHYMSSHSLAAGAADNCGVQPAKCPRFTKHFAPIRNVDRKACKPLDSG
jgi:hypothetical protein